MWRSASRRFREMMRAVLAIAVMIPLVVGCATSPNQEDTAETPPIPAWQGIGMVPVPAGIRQAIEQELIRHDPQRIPSVYRLYGDFSAYAFAVSTPGPATAALDFLTRNGESGDLSWQWALTTTIPSEPRAESDMPPGFNAPLPGGPYVGSVTTGPAGTTSYALYISPDVIIVAGKSDRPAIPAGHQSIRHLDNGRIHIDGQDTSIVVASREKDSSFVAVSGPEPYRDRIIDLIDWDHWALR
ncbi:hypothetical protein [Nitrolancea hollandica]|uniref:hypothetical protein n=1 Tax=Nitrolancea hollandica TaxID=1206749 RepID=UPI000310C92E|nr:hypothetical protein [Nitrolancea hollandica]